MLSIWSTVLSCDREQTACKRMVGKGVMAFLSPPNPHPLENDTKFNTIFWIFLGL